MCGRYAIITEEENIELKEILNEINQRFKYDSDKNPILKTGEIFPTHQVPILTGEAPDKKTLHLFKWGFPNFQKSSGVIINARSETLEEKPTFKKIFHLKRCLVPASGFYEWKKVGKNKEKYLIRTIDQPLFYMAGLYNTFMDSSGNPVTSFVIITTDSCQSMSHIHNRMPVILEKKDRDLWINVQIKGLEEIKPLLKSYPSHALRFLKVG